MSASFDEVRFPVKIAYGGRGGPRYKTTVITVDSGDEQRLVHWSVGRHYYNVASGIKDSAQRDELTAFFHARQGKARGFRFKDWNDYKSVTPVLTNQLTTTTFQIVKRYTSGTQSRVRKIQKPVAGTVAVYNSSTRVLTGFTVDATTGIITFTSAPGYLPLASYEFDVPVRFDTDDMDISRDGYAVNNWDSIPLIEINV